MLCSLFSAIFANFRRKKLAFFSNCQRYDPIFAQFIGVLCRERQFSRQISKIKNLDIGGTNLSVFELVD
jgi:hypothetical protein